MGIRQTALNSCRKMDQPKHSALQRSTKGSESRVREARHSSEYRVQRNKHERPIQMDLGCTGKYAIKGQSGFVLSCDMGHPDILPGNFSGAQCSQYPQVFVNKHKRKVQPPTAGEQGCGKREESLNHNLQPKTKHILCF